MTSAPIDVRGKPLSLLSKLRPIIPRRQWLQIRDDLAGPESDERNELFAALQRLAATTRAMPSADAPEGFRNDAIVHLHYLCEFTHWYVTAKSPASADMEGALAYGFSSVHSEEGQHIDIVDIGRHPTVELDLDWTPAPVAAVRKDLDRWHRQWFHSTKFLEGLELDQRTRRRDVHVRPLKLNGKMAFRPLNDVARGICRLLGKASLSVSDIREIANPDSLGMRVLWIPANDNDQVHELLHHSLRN